MHKVINLQDKIQSINDKRIELDVKRKKALNKKTTFHFNYYELFVLIMELVDNLCTYDDLVRDVVKNEEYDDSLEMYSHAALQIVRLVKKFYKMYLDNDCFSDSKLQLTLSDIDICIEAIEMTCDSFVNIKRNNDETFVFKDEYKELDRYYKAAFYLCSMFKNERKLIIEKAEILRKQSLSKKELRKYEEFEKNRESSTWTKRCKAEDMLYDTYKNHYIKEYRSKVKFIYESTSYVGGSPLWSTYFVKGDATFNKFMAKYKYYRESKDFIYFCKGRLEDERKMNPNIEYFSLGWRFVGDVPTEEEYEKEIYESDNYEFIIEYEDYVLLKLEDEIKNSEEMQDFEFEVIGYEKQQDIYGHFEMLNERLLDKFEMAIEMYCGASNIIYPDGKIGYEFDKIISMCYEN